MSLATLHSRARSGINAPLVTIEVHLANGLPALSIVGLPEMAVRESKDRVRGALINSGFEFPARRITINLAPADLPKEGGRFDLPIALGILAASGQIPTQALGSHEFIGELALSGALRPVRGVLPVALAARAAGRGLILPAECAEEAALVNDIPIHPANHLLAVCKHLIREEGIPPYSGLKPPAPIQAQPDLAEVSGQERAKRALEIAAAGNHSLLMVGPPGTGKSMLACRLPGILPSMTEQESLETAAIRSISNLGFSATDWEKRPFRAPHHTASGVALVGGGSNPRPGEISLAHNGVMFLDELPEFDRKVLEVLREPLESGQVTISRAARQEQFPARFQLIAAMNPCPCGHLGDTSGRSCRCSSEQVTRYRGRISGPLLDRIDMSIEVPRLPTQTLSRPTNQGEPSHKVRQRVEACRQRQISRSGCPNSQLVGRLLEESCVLTPDTRHLIERAMEQLGLSARAYHRILRLSRTIADLDTSDEILPSHLGEAISYRSLDRKA
ncbi:YifB family Mg chelatase-like AAA ATPase [Sedimenticola selenatireducens]|uniref:YifB family Mg chelatase-like AAA ATPase n=1 Tax=Sedimenticola selenatireducens TaxID=191960 RepID=A0A557SI58_9GAMM|nr:YifB family Mg chelatase-like AAA ATPase [Sedimenticola selenatireducens]TVO77012.1 YifB family Mg chelatase-like AAA ATPase [Sedimenticola selenatireducens]TVT64455.1 MAG: YifB family Mg chelatase-like AAA ATPase [Sedimenticola selenatireducens]